MARTINERADVLPKLAEVFRAHGYEGASLALISKATGLGKGSLYHFFPGGKRRWRRPSSLKSTAGFAITFSSRCVYLRMRKLRSAKMFDAVESYFDKGGRVCLVGLFALGEERDRFAGAIGGYFAEWVTALALALEAAGREQGAAREIAEETVAGVQGALVLARSLREPAAFLRSLDRLKARIAAD